MDSKDLDFSALKKAINALEVGLAQPKNEFTRDACIQRFEYTFELSWKTIKRYLRLEAGLEEHNIKNLFREAAQQNLIDNVDHWFGYLKARNLTSHTYNESTAEETYLQAQQFLSSAKYLLNNLEHSIDHSS